MQIQEYTIQNYIDAISNENITMKSLHYQTIISTGAHLVLNAESVLRLYKADITKNTVSITFDQNQKRKYFYKPWVYSFDVFGTSELWRELLDLNHMRSFSEFDHETIKSFSPSIVNMLKTILKLEQEKINYNSSDMVEKIKEATLA